MVKMLSNRFKNNKKSTGFKKNVFGLLLKIHRERVRRKPKAYKTVFDFCEFVSH